MYLRQELNFSYSEDINDLIKEFNRSKPDIMTFDTETTGLNLMTDKPFLCSVAFNKASFCLEPKDAPVVFELAKQVDYFVIHNALFDWNMQENDGNSIPDDVPILDGMTVARLTEFADDDNRSISLETLGTLYVSPNAKFAGKAIKKLLNEINAERLREVKKLLKPTLPKGEAMTPIFEAYRKRVQFVQHPEYEEYFKFINLNYSEPTYEDVYKREPDLMKAYAVDDAIILLEYIKKALRLYRSHYKSEDKVLRQEMKLIPVVGKMVRQGLKADIQYLLDSRVKLMNYIDDTYKKLWELTGIEFKSGQHKVIMDMFQSKYGINMNNCDADALKDIVKGYKDKEEGNIASLIIELRTLDKWLSTYVEGMLNRVINGRIHTAINNSGAVTGRVSSDMQQQPKEALTDRDGNELFHPRRVFINDDNEETYYFD